MHNLGTVFKFEVIRTLKKPTFWIAALAVPILGGLVGFIIFISNKTTDTEAKNLENEHYSIGITDSSHLVAPSILRSLNARSFSSIDAGKHAVQDGKIDAYFYYPSDVSQASVQVYGKDVGLFKNSRYQSLAEALLKQSTAAKTNVSTRAVLQGTVKYDSVTYTKDGQIDKGFLKLIAPGAFLVLFYFMIITFGNQILTSVTEEKENRVIEMILTTIRPTTLLVGKIFSLVTLAFIQMTLIITPVLTGYFLFRNQLSLPQFDLASIPFDPVAIILAIAIFCISFLMYTGILMTLGAAMPTAKEAGSFYGAIMVLLFGPLYAASLFVSSPDSPIVQFLSYFPLTAPIPLLLRNAVGNLPLLSAVISIGILTLTTILVISIGVRIFKFGALEYSRKLSIQEVIKRKN